MRLIDADEVRGGIAEVIANNTNTTTWDDGKRYGLRVAHKIASAAPTVDGEGTGGGGVMAPLLVTLPDLAVGGQVWVRIEAGGPKADWRPHPHATWTPLGRDEAEGGIGGSVEVAP